MITKWNETNESKMKSTKTKRNTMLDYFPHMSQCLSSGEDRIWSPLNKNTMHLLHFIGTSFCFRWFRFVSFSFRWFRFLSFRFCWFRFVSFRFVSFSLISFRFVSLLFRFALYRYPSHVNETKRNQQKRNERKRNQRNENETKRNQRKQNEINENKTKYDARLLPTHVSVSFIRRGQDLITCYSLCFLFKKLMNRMFLSPIWVCCFSCNIIEYFGLCSFTWESLRQIFWN
jgi:hypothetical protein